ncbi:hypothetical protein SCLCIDRAFT_32111 [Scleroderma citrinum Foug A]|uniref:Uncharacterized protein n=1 Tax=Scleroderma citrinum Foug A TaxID=1036808 RepID=A0A0C2ZKK7_9AGAM|nr:hypothetical protein SCLCIDRAFT_32111 [Scleroderma citrinum Foug A]
MPSIMDEINERLRQEREQQQQAVDSHSTSPQPEQGLDSPSFSWEFTNTTTSHNAQRPIIPRHRHERSRSMAEFTSVSSTLGRHNREPLELEEWSTPAKRQLTDFAQEVCADLGVPVAKRDMIVEKSQLPVQKTLVMMMAMLVRNDAVREELAVRQYVSSKEFKENVWGKLKVMLLDPRISNYKDGLLQRALRHIRLNPRIYKISSDVQQAVSSHLFSAEVSAALVYHRNQIKKKLATNWKNKKDIYAVVNDLVPQGMEVTDEMWGRIAWIQIHLAEFKGPDFWQFIDKELATIRANHEHLGEAERKIGISR